MIVQDTKANLTTWNPLKDLIIRVCVLNSAGCGPWSDFFLLEAQEVMGECPLHPFAWEERSDWDRCDLSDTCPFGAHGWLSHVTLYHSTFYQAEWN